MRTLKVFVAIYLVVVSALTGFILGILFREDAKKPSVGEVFLEEFEMQGSRRLKLIS
jgi:hypothetical protein